MEEKNNLLEEKRKEKDDSFSKNTATPSFSRQMHSYHENMERILELNEEEEQKSLKNSKAYPFKADYERRKPSELFMKSTYLKKDSESIVSEDKLCCNFLKKSRKNKQLNNETVVCKMTSCTIF